jgi:hypothetical protein
MTLNGIGFPRVFRISGVLLVLGLCTEAISLRWIHPLAFIAFFVIGGTFLAAGVLLFLYSVVAISHARDTRDPGAN